MKISSFYSLGILQNKSDETKLLSVQQLQFTLTLADPSPSPQRDPILSFLPTFAPQSALVGGRRPHPQREILDWQLAYAMMYGYYKIGTILGGVYIHYI